MEMKYQDLRKDDESISTLFFLLNHWIFTSPYDKNPVSALLNNSTIVDI